MSGHDGCDNYNRLALIDAFITTYLSAVRTHLDGGTINLISQSDSAFYINSETTTLFIEGEKIKLGRMLRIFIVP